MDETNKSKPYALEKWWHRLLRVFGYALTLSVLSVSSLILIEDAAYFTYTYSFEPQYEASSGEEFDCHAYESLKSISCGAFSNGDDFLKFYLSVKGRDTLKDGGRSVNDFFADLRVKGHSDADLAVGVIGQKGYKYRRVKHWDGGKLVVASLSAFAITLACFAALFVLYKVILFVVHGHTRVTRDSHDTF